MKLNPAKSSLSLMLVVGLYLTAMVSSHAATRTKANNADALNLTSSWVGAAVPTSSDVARWDSTVAAANTVSLGANTTWAGIEILNPGGLVTINGAFTLNLGASSVDISSATADLTLSPTTLGFTANQAWNLASGRTLTITPNFTFNNNRTLTLTNSGNLTTTGWMQVGAINSTNTVDHNGGTWSSGVTGNNAILFVGHSTSAATGVGIYNLNGGTIAMTGGQELRMGNNNAGADGTLNVISGAITSSTTTTKLRVGYVDGGKGTYNQSGGTVTVGVMDIAANNTAGGGATGVATNSGGVLNVTTLNIGTTQNGSFTLNNNGRLNLSGAATVGGPTGGSGTLNLNGGTLNMASTSAALVTNSATAIVNANGVAITNGSSGNVTLSAPMTLGAGGITNVTLATTSGRNITFSGNLAGSGGITVGIGGANIVTLSGSNTYTGGVIVKNGTLESKTTQNTLGTGTVVMGGTGSSGATYISGQPNTNAFTINAPDSGTNSIGANGVGAAFTLSGPVTLNGDLMVQSFFSSSLQSSRARPTLNGGITGSGNLILDNLSGGTNTITLGVNPINHNGSITAQGGSLGSNIISAVIGANVTGVTQNSASSPLILSGPNTYSGNTTISAGTLALSGSGTIANTPQVSIATNATFDVSGVTGSGYAIPGGRTTSFVIDKTSGTLKQGQMALGAINLTYGGSLLVTKSGPDALANGDSFTLVTKSSSTLSGWFSSVSLPTLATGLTWDTNNLATTGVLDIYTFTTNAVQTMAALKNKPTTLQISKLTGKTSGARGPVVLKSVSSASGATVGISGSDITYTPPTDFTGTNTFTAILGDGHGTIVATVVVTVSAANVGPNMTPGNVDGFATFTASGMTNQVYTVQLSTNLPAWTDYLNATSAPNGVITFTDSVPVSAHGNPVFYRLKQQ